MRSVFLALFLLLVAVPVAPSFADEAVTSEALDAAWAKRDEPAALKDLEAKVSTVLARRSEDPELIWRAARLREWQADGATDQNRKKLLGRESWTLAERALLKNPGSMQAHYYAALGIGQYSQAVGILSALGEGLEGKFNNHLDTAIKLDIHFESAGGLTAKGRYWYELPWPKRSLARSAETLQKALATSPQNLRAYVYLAETQLKDGKAAVAKATLAKAEQGSVSYDPPEGKRAKEMARTVAAEIAKELK